MQTQQLAMAAAAVVMLGMPTAASAVAQPERAQVSLKTMDYQDRQDQASRIGVKAQSSHWVLPIGAAWALEAGTVVDTISGASPAYYTARRSFAPVRDERRAQDIKASHYWRNQRIMLGQSGSKEVDYLSRSHVFMYSRSTPDNNTTLDLGAARTHDTINPVTRLVVDEKKTVTELLLGLTQVVTPRDLVQVQWVHSSGQGYFNDPYKLLDARPDHRRTDALSLRWNHHRPQTQTTARWQARVMEDSFGIRSATLGLDLAQVLTPQWTLTPSARIYSQSTASFFSAPDPNRPDVPFIPNNFVLGQSHISFDQRLAAFGALTLGLKLEKKITSNTSVDIKYERYRQRNAWSLHGPNVEGLDDFKAQFVQLGLTHKFGR
ncbi:DUF3570 domain-containing protein [Limnohabitans sp. Rim28]|uniref:DUF3570 domain-containing protein n=1 Tax=Limnohabitans sp. Rim28 TaxID=1100720 RepID=UPI000312380C|nr:DUF3570 domain-containing protein [Limnohabitans sp. Rim28]PVE06661.1 hypothetical protein B472_10180 [Limnohabitans sp. Rim28]